MTDTLTNNQERSVNKEYKVGVAILRFYMAFMVVCTHLGGKALFELGGLFYTFQGFHVPTFMMLSFVLCGQYYLEPTKEGMLKRLLRIVIPFITWGVLAFLFGLILWDLSFKDLLWQLFSGFPVNTPLWYLVDMLWISILFWIIRLLSNRKIFIIIISFLAVFSIVAQYTGLNLLMFGELTYNIKWTLGRVIEMIPYATIGIIASMFLPLLNKLEMKHHVIIFLACGVILVAAMLMRWKLISYSLEGFDYQGAFPIFITIILILTGFTNPLNFIKNVTFINIIKWITAFTLGVFCMHSIVGQFVILVFNKCSWPIENVIVASITYGICYGVSF